MYNQSEFLNITFEKASEWLTINPNQGMIIEGQSENVELMVNTNNLIEDTYNAYVSIQSNGGNATLPVILVVNGSLLGDANGDSILNILDVIAIVNMVLGNIEPDLATSDLNGDGLITVLDIIQLLNIILDDSARISDADSAVMDILSDGVSISANGYIGAVQLTLSHEPGFTLTLTDDAFVSEYKTDETSTTLIVVIPESNQIFTTSDVFKVDEVLVANSKSFITVTESVLEFSLSSAYPNPFNPITTIEFSASEAGYASVKVYNLMGQVVGVLMDGMVDAKTYNLTWNAKDLSSGVYMIKAESNGNVATQKVMLLK